MESKNTSTNSKPSREDFLGSEFISKFGESAPAWKQNPLGEFVCRRTYCRVKDNGEYETWRDIIKRVVNGCYALQKKHVESHGLGWSDEKGRVSAQEMFTAMYNMKFLPPGRGLWAMGTDITEKKNIFAALNNCGFTSTADIRKKGSEPFRFLMDMSMLGVGVGFDLKGAESSNKCYINDLRSIDNVNYCITRWNEAYRDDSQREISKAALQTHINTYKEYLDKQIVSLEKKIRDALDASSTSNSFVVNALQADIDMYKWELNYVNSIDYRACAVCEINDTREGWVQSTGTIIDSYLLRGSGPDRRIDVGAGPGWLKTVSGKVPNIIFYYGNIRPAGQLLKTFGGLSSGPEPLLDLHIMIRKILQTGAETKGYVTETMITDIMNLIGKCVVAGNVRRSSEIVLGNPNSGEFMNLKNYEVNPDRAAWGWCSNNSIYADVGMNYAEIQKLIKNNGEPGLFWLDNVQKYSRMNGTVDNKDARAIGTNPCITADTMVLTSEGLKSVRDLIGRKFTAVVHGKEYNSTDAGFWSNGIKPVYRVEFANGLALTATDDHEIYTTVGKIPLRQLNNSHLIICDNELTTLKMSEDHTTGAITILGEQEVYDCTIDEVHCFIANGIKISNCSEQTLEDKELCCLVEVFIARHATKAEFLRTLKFAYLYAKTVTLGDSHWVATNRVMMRNRRIGCSLTGIVQFLANNSIDILRDWLDAGYAEIQQWDRIYSDWLAIPRSIKTTSIKPSGCLSADTNVRVIIDGLEQVISLRDLAKNHGLIVDGNLPEPLTWKKPSIDVRVFNKDNKPEKVTRLFYNGVAEMLTLNFEGGSIKCTPDHKFLVNNPDGTTSWKAARDLQAGDDIRSFALDEISNGGSLCSP